MVGDLDSSGSLNAQVLLLLAERLRAKAVFQVTRGSCLHPRVSFLLNIPFWGSRVGSRDNGDGREGREILLLTLATQTQQSKFLTWQFDGEYRGDDYTATLTLGNPDLIGESGEKSGQVLFILVAHLLMLAMPLHHLYSSGLEKKRHVQAGWVFWGGGVVFRPDFVSPTPVIVVAHFLQSLTHRLVLGGELVYHRRPGEEGAILTLAGKYSGMG